MRAVNLIPVDERRGGGRAGGRSGGGAHVVLAVLAVLVAMVGAWAMAGKQIADRQSDLTRVEADAAAAEARAQALAPYTQFAELSRTRSETVAQIAESRFDWSHALRELARVVPADVDLLSLTATAAPGVGVDGGGGSGMRASLPVPALEIVGCAASQSDVARLMARLRAVDGVQRVTLSSSEKADEGAGSSDTECRDTDRKPQFTLITFFQAIPGAAPATGQAAAPAAPADGPAPAGDQPAADAAAPSPAPQADTPAPAPVPASNGGTP